MTREEIARLNLTYVHRRIKHHASHSGYSALFEHMQIPVATSAIMARLLSVTPASVKWRLNRLRTQPVGDEGLIPELLALPTTRSSKPGICHFIYGEDTYFYTPLWQHANNKIVATYHYPPQRLEERVNRSVLKALSGIVLVSNSQREWFERYVSPEKIHVINHHVDTDFFKPAEAEQESQDGPYRIVSLGGIYRDMELLYNVVDILTNELGPDNIRFDFLIPKSQREPFRKFENVKIHANISDDELRRLYQSATLGFMPLLDCTANNAVLEMMACGKPVICSRVGGIEDYLDSQGAHLFELSVQCEEVASDIATLLRNSERRHTMGKHNRTCGINRYSLQTTKTKIQSMYQKIWSTNI